MTHTTQETTRLVYTDAGIDDAFALIFIGHFLSGGAEAIVCNGGNVSRDLVANNCAYLKDMFGGDSELYLGSNPRVQPLYDAANVHGRRGLGDRRAPEVDLPPVERLEERLVGGEGALEVLVLGPSSDVPRLLSRGNVAERVENLVVMGGAFGVPGNVTRHAEFNVYMDPGAAQEVMEAGCGSVWVPLDATQEHLYTREEALAGLGDGEQAGMVRELFEFCVGTHEELGSGSGVYMHDIIAAAVWLGLVEATIRPTWVERVVGSGDERGRIVQVAKSGEGAEVWYAAGVDHEGFLRQWREVCGGLR